MNKKAYSYIRFSTPDQLKGDSLRRQLESSRAYAKENNLVLDETLRDIGISAFRGKNKTEGALGAFLDLVHKGQIEKGSILIVESLDRLSREEISKALPQFISILSSGVEIITLADDQHYTEKSVNDIGSLVVSLVVMSRAHEESAMKSKRSAASWENRRKLAVETKRPVSGQCPHWLNLSDDRMSFEVIEEYAEIIRLIFKQSIAGVGRRKIAASLNAKGVKPFGPRASKWHTSYVAKLLSSRSIIGEYQPTKGGQPDGPVITGYYPIIILKNTFYQAQASQKSRWNNNSGGRKGVRFTNLFTGMCKCLDCSDTYKFMNRGKSSYLTCDSFYMSAGCTCERRWLYSDVENTALLVLAEKIDWFSALGGHTNSKQLLESDLAALRAKLSSAEKQVGRFAELFEIAERTLLTDARKRYIAAMESVDEISRAIESKESELRTFTPSQVSMDRLNRILFEINTEPDEHKLYELRAEVNAFFRDAGLRLYFNAEGVFYYIKKTKQKGILLIDGMEKELSLAAGLEMINSIFLGHEEFKNEAEKSAIQIPEDDLLERLEAQSAKVE